MPLSRRGFLAAGGAALAAPFAVPSAPAVAASTVERAYAVPGRWVTAVTTVDTRYVVHHPVDLGTRHPVITWGNGTNAVPARYEGLLRHLASWGFVVIASTSTATASGTELLAALDWLPSSRLAAGVDQTRIAAAGHSQGAGGAARACLKGDGRIGTVVAVNPPDPFWIPDADEPDLSRVTVPVLLLTGGRDLLVSPPRTLITYYDRIPGPVARAALRAADHNTVQGGGGGFVGYLTAWLRWHLAGDGYAATAFRGPAELLGNAAWQNQAAKNL